MGGWAKAALHPLPDSAPGDALPLMRNGLLKPRKSSGLTGLQELGQRWALARVSVEEMGLYRGEGARGGLLVGDAVLLVDVVHDVLHPPALVLGLDPEPWAWEEHENVVVEATVLLDRSHEALRLSELEPRLVEQVTFGTGAARGEMRSCLLDLWGLDLTCPRCAGRGGRIQYGLVGRPEEESNPDDEPALGGCVIEPFMHSYACRYCGALWGGAPRFGDPDLLDLAVQGDLVSADLTGDSWSTPVQLRWLNTLLDGIEDLLTVWEIRRFFTDFDSHYGRTVGVDLQRGGDSLELEYNPNGGRISVWDLGIDGSDGPHISVTLDPASITAAAAIDRAGLFSGDPHRDVVILGWNPKKWDAWDPPYEEAVKATHRGEVLPARWSVAARRNIAPGTEVFLLLQGKRRGLVGHGVTSDWPFPAPHYSEPDRTTNYVPLEWDALLPLESRIPREVLELEVPDFKWRSVYSSGWPMSDQAAADLRALWSREVG